MTLYPLVKLLELELQCDSTIPLPGVYPEEMESQDIRIQEHPLFLLHYS